MRESVSVKSHVSTILWRHGRFALAKLGLCALVFVIALAITGCKKPVIKKTPLGEQPQITASDARAQERFDAALDLLEARKWAESREAFRSVQADFGEDPISVLAELYAARTLLEDISFSAQGKLSSSASKPNLEQATGAFDALVRGRRVDDRVKHAASIYLAITWAARSQSDRALEQLEKYPGASLGRAILAEDRIAAWVVLSGAFDGATRYEDALEAMAALHEEVLQQLDNKGEGASAQDQQIAQLLTLYARGRGFAIAAGAIDEQELQMRYLVSESLFLQAAAGWALMQRRADDELDETTRQTLADIYQRSSTAMVSIGALEAAAEMSALMATLGEEKRLVIGAVVPMSGKARPIGQRIMRGMLLGQQAFDFPQDARLTLVFRDSAEDPKENMRVFTELGTLAVVGPIQKEYVEGYARAASEAKLPLITLTTDPLPAPKAADLEAIPQSWVFRNFLHAEAEAVALARLSHDTYQDRRVVIAYPNIGYGKQMAAIFARTIEMQGGEVAAQISYDRSATDYSKLARSVARAKPDAVFIPDSGGKVAEIVSYLAKENIWGVSGTVRPGTVKTRRQLVHYLGTSLWQEPLLLDQAGDYVTGATIPAWYSVAATDAASKAFTDRYRVVYGSEPSIYEAFAYDSVVWLRESILETGMRHPESVRDALSAPTPREGVTGSARFVPWGEADRELRFVTVSSKQFSPMEVRVKVRAREFLEGTKGASDSSATKNTQGNP